MHPSRQALSAASHLAIRCLEDDMNDSAEYLIVIVNLILGFAFGWPLARFLAHVRGEPSTTARLFIYLLAVYFIECAAFTASMSTSILSFSLAVLWGIILGRRLKDFRINLTQIKKIIVLFSIYSSLPAASLLTIPIATKLGGWSILSSEAGARFGIPAFLPWPLCTILGFCMLVSVVTVLLKILITTCLALYSIRRERPSLS
jgi:hypothetical protein